VRGILKHTDSTYTSQLRLDVFSYLNLPGFDQAALGISPVILFIFEENEKKDKDKGKEKKRKEKKRKEKKRKEKKRKEKKEKKKHLQRLRYSNQFNNCHSVCIASLFK